MPNRSYEHGQIPIDCQSCNARIDGLCNGCRPDIQRVIAHYSLADREIKAGRDLFYNGAPTDMTYNIVHGWVFLYNSTAIRRRILHFALPGAVLGFDAPRRSAMGLSAQAMTDVVIRAIPRHARILISSEHPEIGMRLARLSSREFGLSIDHLLDVNQHSVRKQVAHLLLELFIRCRGHWSGHQIEDMHLPIAPSHIADATDLTNLQVDRVLHELKDAGVVALKYRRLSILDPDKLVEVAAVDPRVAMSWVSDRRLS